VPAVESSYWQLIRGGSGAIVAQQQTPAAHDCRRLIGSTRIFVQRRKSNQKRDTKVQRSYAQSARSTGTTHASCTRGVREGRGGVTIPRIAAVIWRTACAPTMFATRSFVRTAIEYRRLYSGKIPISPFVSAGQSLIGNEATHYEFRGEAVPSPIPAVSCLLPPPLLMIQPVRSVCVLLLA
jgi:hypothetical protein